MQEGWLTFPQYNDDILKTINMLIIIIINCSTSYARSVSSNKEAFKHTFFLSAPKYCDIVSETSVFTSICHPRSKVG